MIAAETLARPTTATAMLRGFRGRCPRCGQGKLFRGVLKLVDNCSECGARLGDIRADDLPAYLTVLVVGHIVVPALLLVDSDEYSTTAELAVAIPAALAMIALLLPRFKGAAAGLLWSMAQNKAAAG
jgi:uncharacterized protein (DUF983 family)